MSMFITHASELELLLSKNKKLDFKFEFSTLSDGENNLWFEKIKQNYFECGCTMGKRFLLSALTMSFFGLLFIYFFNADIFRTIYYLYSIVFIFFMAGVGKAVGKLNAYKNLKKDIEDLQFILNASAVTIENNRALKMYPMLI